MKYSITATIVFLIGFSASIARSDSFLLLSGLAANGAVVNLNLVIGSKGVSGTYDVAAGIPYRPMKTTVTGTLTGRNMSLDVSDSSTEDNIAEIRGHFDRSPVSHPGAKFQGSLKLAGKPTVGLQLTELPFGPGSGTRIVTRSIKQHGTSKAPYTIDLEYPQVTGRSALRFVGFNREIHLMMQNDARGYASEDRESALPDMPDREISQSITFNITEFTDRLISVRFLLADDSGGEHPNYGAFTVNYDLKLNHDVSLTQLFANHKTYLHAIAVKTIAVLAQNPNLDYNQIVSGAQTSITNYSAWNLTRTGLIFTFDPYQVGPFSVGMQQINFPLDSLAFAPLVPGLLK